MTSNENKSETSKSNVKSLADKKAKQEAEKALTKAPRGTSSEAGDKPRIPKAFYYNTIAEKIDQVPGPSRLPDFPERFYAVEVADGVRNLLVEKENRVVKYVPKSALTYAIAGYVTRKLASFEGYAFEARHARDCMEQWLSTTIPIPEPKVVAWKDDPELCFSRLPWKQECDLTGEKTKLFNELFSRISNADALMQWIGSLFISESDIQQYVWLYGKGKDGKGVLSRFLSKVFQHAYRSMQPPKDDKHWTEGLLGARVVVFPDCDDTTFVQSGFFKTLTGGDPVAINPKGLTRYTTVLHCKYMVLSNDRPSMSSQKSNMRRNIFCEAKPLGDDFEDDSNYEKKLWEEGGYFLSRCIERYLEANPKHGAIKSDQTELEAVVSTTEEPFEVCFKKYFQLGTSPEDRVTPEHMQAMLVYEFKGSQKQQTAFRAYIERLYGVRRTQKRDPGTHERSWCYPGIKFKPGAFPPGNEQREYFPAKITARADFSDPSEKH